MNTNKYLTDIDEIERAVEAGINNLLSTDEGKARLLDAVNNKPETKKGKISIEFDSQAFAEWIKNQPEEHLDMLQQIVDAIRKNKRIVHFNHAKNVKNYEHVYQTEVSAYVLDRNTVLGFLFIKNGCCPDRPVLLVGTETVSGMYYSCQCACGEFITGMFKEPAEAVAAYANMFGDKLPF